MPSYNSTTFNPPAPVALVGLKHKNTDEMTYLEMLIDTGADSSLVPRSIASRLGYGPLVGKGVDVFAFDGRVCKADVIQADLYFENKIFRGEYLLSEDSVGILGRDILNRLIMEFDGPGMSWQTKTRFP